jgi:hypothetical protein
MANPTKFSGLYNASQFAYGIHPNLPPLLVVSGPNTTTGAQALTLAFGSVATPDGLVFSPLNTNANILVGGDSAVETVTPSAVSTSTPLVYGTTSVTSTFANLHGMGDQVCSGTVGLQEALNYVGSVVGGGIVVVDETWYKLGGTSTILAAASVPSGVSIWDNHAGAGTIQSVTQALTLTQIQNAYTTSVNVIPAPGAGNMVDVLDATINLIFGTNAFTTGGAAQLSYGTGVTYPATATVAASVYTGLAANTIQKVAGAAVAATSSDYLNKGIYYSNATAAFAAGTGCSAVVVANYRIIQGLS